MTASTQCPQCGAGIPPGTSGGQCLSCLLQLGLSTAQTGAQVPMSRETDAHFGEESGDGRSGERIGRYRLIERIGAGGFGIVFLAEQEQPVRRRVALKIIKPGMDTQEVIARFEAERQALALMDHAGIAKVFDGGTTPAGHPYFVMEFVAGVKITDYCDTHALSLRERLQLFIQVCQAVQHAHQKGIIHRDLKPSNILVTEQDGRPLPKVIDFGIAKAALDRRLTSEPLYTTIQQFAGTPAYMSPEQAGLGGLDVDSRSDIYSLGMLLYELLTAQPAFEAAELARAALDEIFRTIREKQPPRPSARLTTLTQADLTTIARRRQSEPVALRNHLRGDLDWIVMKALEKDRNRRYETASGLAMDIQRHLLSEPVLARPPDPLYRFNRLMHRNKLACAAVAAVTLALVCGSGFSTWSWLREKAARQRALAAEHTARHEAARAEGALGDAENARRVADAERQSAEQALQDLKKTAPTFAAVAKTLLDEGKFEEAIEKIGYAIQLDENHPDYHLFRANLLEATQQLAEAATEYQCVLDLRANDEAAKRNLTLCQRLLRDNGDAYELRKNLQFQLLDAMRKQGRLVEMGPLSALLEPDLAIAEATIRARLHEYKNQPEWEDKRIDRRFDDTFNLDLSGLRLGDLSLLKGLPIYGLNLQGAFFDKKGPNELSKLAGVPLKTLNLSSTKVEDIEPLRGMPLIHLDITDTPVKSISPLRGMQLNYLDISRTGIIDLSPLAGMQLRYFYARLPCSPSALTDLRPLAGMPLIRLELAGAKGIHDLSPLKGAPLERMILHHTGVSDLTPLAGMPLDTLDVQVTDVTDISPLAQCPKLGRLILHATKVRDLSPLAKIKLRYLDCSWTNVTSLEPLRGNSLNYLKMDGYSLSDVSPLAECLKLEQIVLPTKPTNVESLRKLPKLRTIGTPSPPIPVDQFWKDFDASKAAAAQ